MGSKKLVRTYVGTLEDSVEQVSEKVRTYVRTFVKILCLPRLGFPYSTYVRARVSDLWVVVVVGTDTYAHRQRRSTNAAEVRPLVHTD